MLPASSRGPPGPTVATVVATVLTVLLVFGAYVLQSKAGGFAGLASSRHLVLFAALLAVVATAALYVYVVALRGSIAGIRRQFLMPLLASIGVIVLALVAAELTLRSVAVPTPIGLRVGNLDLLPYDWERVRQSTLSWLKRTRGDAAVFDMEDAELGWNVGRGRRSQDGRYATSAEGLRSAEPGRILSTLPAAGRVALIGDSFTFGEEVAFSETWGEYLANDLPPGTQVLNFGVPGHAMDQTLLKFRRDVRPWQPKVVVFSFLSASPLRNTGIYLFLRPDLELPYSKPRFRLVNGQLELLNFPPRSAASLLAEPSVWNLPLLELDSEFEARHWTMPLFGGSYLARYVAASFPRWTPRRERFPDDAIVALAVRVIRQMVTEIEADGAVPIVVSLPVMADLAGGPTHYRDAVTGDLGGAGIEVLDLAPCLMQGLSMETAFVGDAARSSGLRDPGMAHYSPAGNRAVAACLRSHVSTALDLR